jgi:hypothetical protein
LLRESRFCLRESEIRLAEDGKEIRESGNQIPEGLAEIRVGVFNPTEPCADVQPGPSGISTFDHFPALLSSGI